MYSALMYFLEPEEDEEGGGGFEAVFLAVALRGDTQTERYVCLQSLMGGKRGAYFDGEAVGTFPVALYSTMT